ncbi:MAG: hypothetical protein OEV25_05760 [Deltaproteobacteria bacterium]|nr:hypothetical protein [Deltaproteobacteria bacterium]
MRASASLAQSRLTRISHSNITASKSIRLQLLTRIFHELLSRDREDGRATGQPQGVGSEAYL